MEACERGKKAIRCPGTQQTCSGCSPSGSGDGTGEREGMMIVCTDILDIGLNTAELANLMTGALLRVRAAARTAETIERAYYEQTRSLQFVLDMKKKKEADEVAPITFCLTWTPIAESPDQRRGDPHSDSTCSSSSGSLPQLQRTSPHKRSVRDAVDPGKHSKRWCSMYSERWRSIENWR